MAFESTNPTTTAGEAVACTLGAADLSRQTERWRRLLDRAATARLDTSGGIRVQFRPDAGVADELGQLVAVENACCSWAEWSVEVVADELVLDVTSAGDGVAALRGMLLL